MSKSSSTGVMDAVLAVDDAGVGLAALLSERLHLPGNSAHAVRRVRDKLAFRRLLQEREFLCPGFHHLPTGEDARELELIVEDFIPGREHALEGTLNRGKLTTLALFDKPDPLDGPTFEETISCVPRIPSTTSPHRGVKWLHQNPL